jgi:hypothetical protein
MGQTTGKINAGLPKWGRFTKAMADANYTLLAAEYDNRILEFTGALTATRTITLPLEDGREYVIKNACTGGSLTFQPPTGTGVTIATVKSAIIYCDGTNYVRVTADA